MGKLLRVRPFVLLIVAWLAGLVRLHAWAQEEAAMRPTCQATAAESIALRSDQDAHRRALRRASGEPRHRDDDL